MHFYFSKLKCAQPLKSYFFTFLGTFKIFFIKSIAQTIQFSLSTVGVKMLNNFQLSTTGCTNFQQLFCFQPLGLRFKTTYCLNHLKTAVFLKKHFCLRFSATFFVFNRCYKPSDQKQKDSKQSENQL